MKHIIAYLQVVFLLFTSCTIEKKESRIDESKTIKNKIDSLGNRYLELGRFSGTIAIADKDAILYKQSFGLADYENDIKFSDKTAFKIGELSQLITYEIFQGLIQKGKLKSSETILLYTNGKTSKIKIQHILRDSIFSIDYKVLDVIIQQTTGRSFESNVQNYSELLRLENTFYDKKTDNLAKGYTYQNIDGNGLTLQPATTYELNEAFSNSGIKSTALDLLKILKSKKDTIEIAGYMEDDGFSYAVANNLDEKYAIVILSNRRHPIADEMMNSIECILSDKKYTLPLARKPFPIDSKSLGDFTGNYVINKNVNFEVIQENDSLYILLGNQKVNIIPQSQNQFYMNDRDAAMRFIRNSNNQVDKVELLNGFIQSDQIAWKSQ